MGTEKLKFKLELDSTHWDKPPIAEILIGDKLNIETKLVSWKRGIGECFGQGFVKGELACQANFGIIVPDILNKFKVKRD